MISIWTKTMKLPHFPMLENNLTTDVLVIGGGISGILTAYMLSRAGIDYALLEASEICSGITQNTTAKITAQHGLIYHKIIEKYGTEKAKMYLDANLAALQEYSDLCRDIDCDFTVKNSFIYSMHNKNLLSREYTALEQLGYSAEYVSRLPLPFDVTGAICFPDQAEFHPLKFLAHIAKELNIYEHSPVREMIGTTARTDRGKVHAKKVIVTTHFPFINKHGFYFLKLYQHRSYVLALENAADIDGMYADDDSYGLSFRKYGNYLLLGGGAHRTGKPGGNWAELQQFAKTHYPNAKAVYRWATQDCMSLDGIPYIGQYAKNTPDLYVASGFNKWGMTSSMAAAMILCSLVQGKPLPYAEVFLPSRSILHPQLAVNTASSLAGWLSFTKKRCPHLGCALKWNPQEHSWDCPCHGSRFTEQGKLIDNPATDNLKK